MTNLEALDRIDQAQSTMIDRLFWIAGSLESSDLKDMLEEMDDEDYKEILPELYNNKYFSEYRKDREVTQMLVDARKLGLIAELHIPECSGFSYKGGRPTSWTSSRGVCRIAYAYAETMDDLVLEIEKIGAKIFKEFVRKDKAKNKKKAK